ncbi:MAG: hypothetical protein AAF441_19985, partial [Pseudomonadota bacterium]
MSAYLCVPIHLDALVVRRQEEVVGPTLDVSRAPWFGTGNDGVLRDHFPQTANVAGAIRIDPMDPNNRYLTAGIHLHWALPDALTHGTTKPPNSSSFVERNSLWFPKAPNRWLVLRSHGTAHVGSWLIESDFVHPWGTGTGNTAYSLPPEADWPYPFARVGRITKLETGAAAPAAGTSLAEIDRALTAVGPGDASFAALYTGCHSIFGMHDTDVPGVRDGAPITYEVIGWYADPGDAPLAHWADLPKTGNRKEMIAGALSLSTTAPKSVDQIKDRDLKRDGLKAQDILFRNRSGWSLPEGARTSVTACAGFVFYGKVVVAPTKRTKKPAPVSSAIAVGNSTQEAICALLANKHSPGNPGPLEERLEAVRFDVELKDDVLDFTAKLRE